MTRILSICIPTYNRAEYLRECLISVLTSIAGHERDIEVLISDNASTDNTENVIRGFQETYPWIRYHRNEQNIGAERNFYLLATLAQGENIWIFGDDDKMEENAVTRVLNSIRVGYGLTICNYSSWDKQFSARIKKSGFPWEQDQEFNDPNELLKHFGLYLGYISSIVIKRNLFLRLPLDEYETFVEYGFPFLYVVYASVADGACKVEFIAEPLFLNRGGNSGNYDWYKYFAVGSSLVFDKLQSRGYAESAVISAKHQVLRDFVIPNLFYRKALDNDNKISIGLMSHHYNKNWLFWAACVPVFFVPRFLVRFAKNVLIFFRRLMAILQAL